MNDSTIRFRENRESRRWRIWWKDIAITQPATTSEKKRNPIEKNHLVGGRTWVFLPLSSFSTNTQSACSWFNLIRLRITNVNCATAHKTKSIHAPTSQIPRHEVFLLVDLGNIGTLGLFHNHRNAIVILLPDLFGLCLAVFWKKVNKTLIKNQRKSRIKQKFLEGTTNRIRVVAWKTSQTPLLIGLRNDGYCLTDLKNSICWVVFL